MFNARFFATRYFAARYFPKIGAAGGGGTVPDFYHRLIVISAA